MDTLEPMSLECAMQRAADAEACYRAAKLVLKFLDDRSYGLCAALTEAIKNLPEYKANEEAKEDVRRYARHTHHHYQAWFLYSEAADNIKEKMK